MKKLLYIFLGLSLTFGCSDDSSDDSSDGNQLFIEKYDSVVWERLPLGNDYSYRIAFINSSNSVTQYSYLEGEEENCTSFPITRNN